MWSVAKRSMLVGMLCLAGASGTAYAGVTSVLEVKVPFPFIVGDQTLPAGEYRIQRDDFSTALMIRSEHGTASAILNTRPARGRAERRPARARIQARRGQVPAVERVDARRRGCDSRSIGSRDDLDLEREQRLSRHRETGHQTLNRGRNASIDSHTRAPARARSRSADSDRCDPCVSIRQ